MGKRVGITKDIADRESYWRREYPHLTWHIEATRLTYEQAQSMENEFIARGYEGSPGGPREECYIYFVYTFEY